MGKKLTPSNSPAMRRPDSFHRIPSFSDLAESVGISRVYSFTSARRMSGDGPMGQIEDDDPMEKVRQWFRSSAIVWWFASTMATICVLLSGNAPTWLWVLAGAEVYAGVRRFAIQRITGEQAVEPVATRALRPGARKLRHFVSFRFTEEARPDELVAAFAALEALPSVAAIELGLNCSPEGLAKGHTHAFLVTFAGVPERDAYLSHLERRRFWDSAAPFVADVFVLDFETSG